MDNNDIIIARNELICNLLQTCANRDILDISQLEQKAELLWSWVIKGSGLNRPEDNRIDDSSTATKKPRRVREGSTSIKV
tara:strand:- start:690 stop:929 length:240 start_codon:yes stop_codon:yes gene_type:complete